MFGFALRRSPRIPDILPYTIFMLFAILATGAAVNDEPLKCYQCRVEKNEECTEEFLRECPTDQAYDVCMVSVINNEGHVYIEKKCALGPCSLRDPKQSDGLGLDKCDRSRNSYSCFECCKGSGCNTGSSSTPKANFSLVLCVAVFSLLVSLGMRHSSIMS